MSALPEAQAVPIATGSAGASALREHERRAARELRRKEKAVADDAAWRQDLIVRRPLLGRIVSAVVAKPEIGPESQSTRAWKTGAAGEVRVAEILSTCSGVLALHDRRIPASKANIDHIAVAPTGVYVIDAKKYVDQRVERRDVGPLWRVDERLYVGGRDRTKLTDGLLRQLSVVRDVLKASGREELPVKGVLCFVEADWSLWARPFVVNGVTAVWPKGLPGVLTPPTATPTICDLDSIARDLAAVLVAA